MTLDVINETLGKKNIIKESQIEQKKLSNEQLQTIKNHDFLSISPENRLQYITKNNINSNDLVKENLRIKNLEFTFTFDGKFNKELYLKTTAGQVLPKEVKSVEKNGIIYSRDNLSGEFFSSWGRRLIIKEGTKIEILEIRRKEEVKKLEKENNTKTTKYLSKNKKTKDYSDIVSQAISRWIDPKFAILAFSEKVKNLPLISKERKILIEEMFTEYDRQKWKLGDVYKNKKQAVEISILKEYADDWKSKAKDYRIEEEVIKDLESSSNKNIKNVINIDKISGWDLSKIDFRILKSKYPREASIKNNNPAGITWNPTYANTLRSYWINFYKWTARPSKEWGHYFWFENMEDWMNAYNLLWKIKLKKMWNKTFWDFAKNWAADYSSYKRQFWKSSRITSYSIRRYRLLIRIWSEPESQTCKGRSSGSNTKPQWKWFLSTNAPAKTYWPWRKSKLSAIKSFLEASKSTPPTI